MEIKGEILKQLGNLSDEQLKSAASVIARAMGANPLQANMAAQNIGAFRAKASQMSESELREAVSRIPPEKAAEIMKMLGIKGEL